MRRAFLKKMKTPLQLTLNQIKSKAAMIKRSFKSKAKKKKSLPRRIVKKMNLCNSKENMKVKLYQSKLSKKKSISIRALSLSILPLALNKIQK